MKHALHSPTLVDRITYCVEDLSHAGQLECQSIHNYTSSIAKILGNSLGQRTLLPPIARRGLRS